MFGFWGYVQDTLPVAQQSSIPSRQQDTAVIPQVQRKASPIRRVAAPAPVKDTVYTPQAHTGLPAGDSVSNKNIILNKDTIHLSAAPLPVKDTSWYKLTDNPFLPGITNPTYLVIKERHPVTKDKIFYLVAGLLLFLAFIKLVFPKYFRDVFRLFFQPSFRQKQTREQLLQSNLPSLLYNLFFVLSGGAYIALLFQYFRLVQVNFWWLYLYSTGALAVLYIGKFIILSFSGWLFHAKSAADTYIFIVYLINKIIGVILIPFILLIAFSTPQIINVAYTISFLVLSMLFLYRYLISYAPVMHDLKVSAFHFFFYICAFEIAPLLVIYKLLTNYLNLSV